MLWMFEYIYVGINTSKNGSSGWWRTFLDEKLHQSSISILYWATDEIRSLELHLHTWHKKHDALVWKRENQNKFYKYY